MNRDIPAIASSAYTATSYSPHDFTGVAIQDQWAIKAEPDAHVRRLLGNIASPTVIAKPQKENEMGRRLVQVFIADPDENVPLDQAMIYSGEQKFTDATDQELFFEVDINKVLKDHNEKRVKLINKKIKDRTEHLEPAKIRDLKMVVVNIATF